VIVVTVIGRGLVLLVAAGLTAVAAPATSASVPAADSPGLSGTTTYEGHTLTWSTGGVSAVPADRPDLAESYDGVVAGGATITFSGTMAYTIGEGYVTNLSQSAGMSGAANSPPSVTYSGRVGGTSITTPFSLAGRAPWTKDMTAQPNGVAASIVLSASSRNCNDWGVCGGPGVELVIAVMKTGAGGPKENKPPTVKAVQSGAVTGIGDRIRVRWSLNDDSGRAKWFAGLFSGGTLVGKAQSSGLVKATGGTYSAYWPASAARGAAGPFYTCFYAQDKAGLTSANAPMSTCTWHTVQVPIPLVSNGCGAAWGQIVEDTLNWIGDTRVYGGKTVNIRPACNQHDAGYAGVAVAGLRTKKVTDYRTWTREQVDQKFYDDIMKQCRQALAGPANAALLKQCQQDAYTYVGLVRQFGQAAFDADVTVPGVQSTVPASTNPPGGARNNA
jgi:hypothetical protein